MSNKKYNYFQRLFRKKYIQRIDNLEDQIAVSTTDISVLQKKIEILQAEKEALKKKNEIFNNNCKSIWKEASKLKQANEKKDDLLKIYGHLVPGVNESNISLESVERDDFIINKLSDLEDKIQLAYAKEKLGYVDEEDKKINKQRIRRYKSEIIGVVAAYRDLLPREELEYLKVNGKEYPEFLSNMLKSIIKDTDKSELYYEDISILEDINNPYKRLCEYTEIKVGISKSDLDYLRLAYREITSEFDIDAKKNYDGAGYTPFEYGISNPQSYTLDQRSDGYGLYYNILSGKNRSLYLYGSHTNKTRSTIDPEKPTRVESVINDIDNTISNRIGKDLEDPTLINELLHKNDISDNPIFRNVYVANHRY